MLSSTAQFAPSQAAEPAPAALPRAEVLQRGLRDDPEQRYFLYVPEKLAPGARVLVTVHGISRNAREHARRFARRAERYGVVLVAPLFDAQRHRDYQRLGRRGQGPRADGVLARILDEVSALTGADTRRVYLFGYSGGGQFVHRFALAHPDRVAAVAVGAAGWYTFPDPKRRYPFGIGRADGLPGVEFDPQRFLRVPAYVFVGEDDVARDVELNDRRRIDRQQGVTRLERGRRWVTAMRIAAREAGLDTRFRFEVLPEADHSFTRSMRRGKMGKRVFRSLFGPPPARADEPREPALRVVPARAS